MRFNRLGNAQKINAANFLSNIVLLFYMGKLTLPFLLRSFCQTVIHSIWGNRQHITLCSKVTGHGDHIGYYLTKKYTCKIKKFEIHEAVTSSNFSETHSYKCLLFNIWYLDTVSTPNIR